MEIHEGVEIHVIILLQYIAHRYYTVKELFHEFDVFPTALMYLFEEKPIIVFQPALTYSRKTQGTTITYCSRPSRFPLFRTLPKYL